MWDLIVSVPDHWLSFYFDAIKILFDKMTVNLAILTLCFLISFFIAQRVHAWVNRLVPELLLKPSDTSHAQ